MEIMKIGISVLFFLILLCTCQKKVYENINDIKMIDKYLELSERINIRTEKTSENISAIINIIRIDEIELSNDDFQIIDFTENKYISYKNGIIYDRHADEIILGIKIINKEKLLLLKELINPIIELEIENEKHMAKSLVMKIGKLDLPENGFFIYTLDENYGLRFGYDNILSFTKYKNN
jgi:hypothetical protein